MKALPDIPQACQVQPFDLTGKRLSKTTAPICAPIST